MKVTTAFILVAYVAATYAAPAPKAVDWNAVGSKIDDIGSRIRWAVQQIKSIANNDNKQVGSSVSDQLDAAVVQALAILQQAKDAVSGRSLTEDKARELVGQIKEILVKFVGDIAVQHAQLSASAVSRIRQIISALIADIERLGQELYALLRQ